MDLHIILLNLYEGSLYPLYVNALFLSKKYGGAVITHQEYMDIELKYEECFLERFLNILDMEKITEDDKKKIKQFGISKEFLENLEKHYSSRTQMLLHLIRERDEALEEYLYMVLDACPEQVSRIYVFGETYESVKYIANEKNITIINYELSTVRKESAYTCSLRQTYTCGNLYSHQELLKRYTDFCAETDKNTLLKREELIALFVPKRQIMLIPLIYEKPTFEIGILNTGFGIIPAYCRNAVCTDDDVYSTCRKYYKPNEIVQRKHPATVTEFERSFYELDTVSFILSCKRIAAVSSNGLFEAMLWGRTSCIALDAMAFYFMCEHDFSSEKIVDETFLNFYLISALVPSPKLLFNPHYWEMRAKMSEIDLYHYHLNYILDLLGLDKQILDVPMPKRLDTIIAYRGVDPSVLSKPKFKYDSPFYKNIRSELHVHGNGEEKVIECVNYQADDEIISSFNINESINHAEFYPHKEKTGFIEIRRLVIDGKEVWAKNDGLEFVLQQYKKEISPLPVQSIKTLQVIWKSQDISANSMRQISEQYEIFSEQHGNLSRQHENLNEQCKILNTEISSVYDSLSWRITKPLRKIGGCLNWKKENKK